jgi:hypothetical protein
VSKLILIFFLFFGFNSFSVDSTRVDTSHHHIRKRAAIFSAVVPGMGQFYNEIGHRKVQGRAHVSWWRAPLIWGGLGFTGYLAFKHGTEANKLKTEWVNREGGGDAINYIGFEQDDLINGVGTSFNGFDTNAKFRDYAVAGFVVVYALNILDAFIDAHFVTFDVSQNLTLSLMPQVFKKDTFGANLTLKFN